MEKFIAKARISAFLFLGALTFFSVTAEIWSSSRPLMMQYKGQLYWPVLLEPSPIKLGVQGRMRVDYRKLSWSQDDWALWALNPWDPYETDRSLKNFPSPPSRQHWLGVDDRGRDVFARLLYGFRLSLLYALLSWALSSLLALWIGGICGYYGSHVDMFGQRIIEVLSTIPQFLVLIYLISIVQPSLILLSVLTASLSWMGLSRYARSGALRCRKLEFIEAAKSIGATDTYILFRHIIPNIISPLLSFAPFILSGHLIGLAALSYLGFGPPPPTPNWGEVLSQGQLYFGVAWWLTVFPALAFFMTLLSLIFMSQSCQKVTRF